MDLGTIKRRMQNKYYWKADECTQDFKQTIANCKVFNIREVPVVKWAEVIEKEFLKRSFPMTVSRETLALTQMET